MVRAALLVLVGLLAAVPARAQSQRLYGKYGDLVAELDTAPATFGRALRTWRVPYAAAARDFYAPGNGRYLLFATLSGLSALDTVTGTVFPQLIPDFFLNSGPGAFLHVDDDGVELVADGIAPPGRVVAAVNLATGARRTWPLPGNACTRIAGYARQRREVFVLRGTSCLFGTTASYTVDALDVDTGALRTGLAQVTASTPQSFDVDAAGTRLLACGGPWAGGASGCVAVDLRTGATTATNAALVPVSSTARVLEGPRPGMASVVTAAGLTAFDAGSLVPAFTADGPRQRVDPALLPPGVTASFDQQVAVHPDAEAIYAFESTALSINFNGGPCVQGALLALDPVTGARLATADTAQAIGLPICGVALAMAVAPSAPTGLLVQAAGDRVSIAWDRPARTEAFEIQVGSAPGLTDIARGYVSGPALSVEHVPAGTYHLRIRAINFAGGSPFSQDVVVEVP